MAHNRTSSFWLLLWGGLLFLGLRPGTALEHGLDTLLAPLRFAAELGAPFGLLRAGDVAAAERELALRAESESAEGAATLERLAELALPRDPALRAGRRFLPAAVIGRPNKDECWVGWPEPCDVPLGTPVVCGDAYVGRVVETRADPRPRARVELVTDGLFRVGAEVRGAEGDGPTYLTVGGVRVPPRKEARSVRLAAHQPSSSRCAGGLATVRELFADADASAALAEGFRLGRVRRDERDDDWVEPELDFLDGLFHVALVLAPDAEAPVPAPARSGLQDGHWLGTRALSTCDPSPWRSTLKVPLGRGDGVRVGAAVTSIGARLVGRVLHVGTTTSDVALLADPGFRVAAIARLEGEAEPRVLGRLSTLGRGADGTLRVRWWVRVPLALPAEDSGAASGVIVARIFTGSGEAGLPEGLFLGTAELPRAAAAGEERELLLRPGFEPSGVARLFLRRADEGDPP